MPSSLPQAADLVAVVREFLEREILPESSGARWFNVRVAANVLAMVERELQLGRDLDAAEAERLRRFVSGDSREEMVKALSDGVREGRIDWRSGGLAEHLLQTCEDALKVNNPKWLR
ncbi:DUF6285 domain-containing protein [Camelimonas abortus]|uniref:DUF6285 domain-containing protein n=1 Tax=Camelimonas abortus TaxID=1017184 RepID=A0ABV7LFD7_9HYPH